MCVLIRNRRVQQQSLILLLLPHSLSLSHTHMTILSFSLSHSLSTHRLQTVLDNPTCFLNPFQFEITFECLQELDDGTFFSMLRLLSTF